MKATLLLAIALFLISAPTPDPDTISEMTSHFIVLDEGAVLQAAETPETRPDTDFAETDLAE